MSREDPQMKIRLPADLKDRIEELSKQAGRSMNAEIVIRLQDSLNPAPTIFINEQTGVTAVARSQSRLAQMAGELNELQGQRNTLAVVLHSLKTTGASPDEVKKVEDEVRLVDAEIATVLSSMKAYTSR